MKRTWRNILWASNDGDLELEAFHQQKCHYLRATLSFPVALGKRYRSPQAVQGSQEAAS